MREPRKTMSNKGNETKISLHKEVMFYPLNEVATLKPGMCESLLRCVEGWPVLDKARKFEDLEVVIDYPIAHPIFLHIAEATYISDILVPVAETLMNEVYWNEAGAQYFQPHHSFDDLIFECITIYEDNKVQVFIGS